MAQKIYKKNQGGYKDANMVKIADGSMTSAASPLSSAMWNGKDVHLAVGHDRTFISRALMYFGIDFSDMASITDATLYMTYSTSGNHSQGTLQNVTKVRRMAKDWGEGSDPQPAHDGVYGQPWNWNTRYTNTNGSYEVSPQNFTQGTEGQVVGVVVTDIVKAWAGHQAVQNGVPDPNYGVQIATTDDAYIANNKALCFYSGDYDGGSSSPYLVINYVTDTAPIAPISLTPTGGAIVNTTIPSLSFTQSDIDVGDHMASYNVEVYDTAVTDPATATDAQTYWKSGEVATVGTVVQSASVPYGTSSNTIIYKALVPGASYKWRAATKDSTGKWGPFSALQSFTVNAIPNAPTLTITPAPTTDVPDDTPIISITHNDPDPADTNMYAYRVIVESESTPGSGSWSVVWDSGDADTSGAPVATSNVTTGTLTWGASCRVRARTKDSQGAWSGYTSNITFTVHQTAVAASMSPTASVGVSATPTIAGSRGSIADTITAFSIRAYTDSLSSTVWAETRYTTGIASGGASFSKAWAGSALSAGSAYQWQVQLESTIGGVGTWSDLQRFVVVDAGIPSVFEPTGTGVSLTPTVRIERVGTFDAVKFQIYDGVTLHYQSGTITTSISAAGIGTRYSASYSGTALVYDKTYGLAASVSSDGGSVWTAYSGQTQFSTDNASTPVLTSVAGDAADPAWITDSTPDFIITRGGADTIDWAQVNVWDKNGTILIWDSGLLDVADATTATITYAGAALSTGTTYRWNARYQKTTGPTGPYSATKSFRLNGGPFAPDQLFPPPGHVFIAADTKTFQARFDDPEVQTFSDYPADWEIEIEEIDETPHDIQTLTSSLVVGLNSVTWPGTAFVADTEYQWRTRFRDSKTVWGAYSGWQSFTYGTPPNGTISTPSNGSTISSVTPNVTWTLPTGVQASYTIRVTETTDAGVPIKVKTTLQYYGDELARQIPAGHFENYKYYDITLTVKNTFGLSDPTPSTVNVRCLLDAPSPITGLTPTIYEDLSLVRLQWNTMSLLAGHTFIAYRLYKKLPNDNDWQFVYDVLDQSTVYYDDWYAGNQTHYHYRIVAVTTKASVSVEMESPDDPYGGSFAFLFMDDNQWVFIGADRSPDRVYRLTVLDESHNRPIQQEVFETLGSSRKVIMRGFVLGHEGSLTTLWLNRDVALPSDEQVFVNETVLGRRIVDYLSNNAGPHILKSPFGDVWDSQFMSPEYQWQSTGHLEVTLEFVETGNTSQVSI